MHVGHHELPPVAHTTMLRDFPSSLQRSAEAVIPPRPSASPASDYHQLYVSNRYTRHPGNRNSGGVKTMLKLKCLSCAFSYGKVPAVVAMPMLTEE